MENIFNVEGRYYILDDKDFMKHDEVGVGDNEYKMKKSLDGTPQVWWLRTPWSGYTKYYYCIFTDLNKASLHGDADPTNSHWVDSAFRIN